MRGVDVDALSDVEVAAWMIYVNRTCFAAGSLVLTHDERYVPIESVEIGRKLWNGRIVQETLRRQYYGKLLRIHARSSPYTMSVTEDHPVLMVPGRIGKQERRTDNELESSIQLLRASELVVGDLVLQPRSIGSTKQIDWRQYWESITLGPQAKLINLRMKDHEISFARLMGYYVAEGCVTRRYSEDESVNGVELTFNSERTDYISDAIEILSSIFEGAHVAVSTHATVKKTSVRVTSVHVGRFMESLVSGQSWAKDPQKRGSKRLHHDWLTAPLELQRELLKGWLRGDGNLRLRGKSQIELVGTCSVLPMARQLYRMAQRCGLRPAWRLYYPNGHEMAVLSFCNLSDVHALGFALEVQSRRKRCERQRTIGSSYVAVRIDEIIPLWYDGEVFNLEVDGDHLLCVDNTISHNCFNGLYRVNRQGRFNVPFGRYDDPTICDEPRLRACSVALRRAEIVFADFEETVKDARAGDLVYLDPPYAPLSRTSSFTAYTKDGFSEKDHVRLRDAALVLKERGAHVILSHSDCELVRDLYLPSRFCVRPVLARRSINSKGGSRGAIGELVIT
jgi:hypothetical protein